MLLIIFFVIVLNVVAILLTYHCLANMSKKEKLVFIAGGIAVIYILTYISYWISSKTIAVEEVSDTVKDIIIFLFVPINAIVILPILAKSYEKYKIGTLGSELLKKRVMVLCTVLLVLLIIEYFYFVDIQNGIIATLTESSSSEQVEEETEENSADENADVSDESSYQIENTNELNSEEDEYVNEE